MPVGVLEEVIQFTILGLVILVAVSTKPNTWATYLGSTGRILIIFCISFLFVGTVVPIFYGVTINDYLVLRQVYYFLILVGVLIAARYALESIGIHLLLKRLLYILLVSCSIIIATPILRQVGLLPEFRFSRATGVFSDPNDAGLVATITVTISGCLIYGGHYLRFSYLCLLLGIIAAVLTFSITSALVLGTLMVLGFVVTITRLGQPNSRQQLILSLSTFSILTLYVLWSLSLLPDIAISENETYQNPITVEPDPFRQIIPVAIASNPSNQITPQSLDASASRPYFGYSIDGLEIGTEYDVELRPIHDSWIGEELGVSGNSDFVGNLQIYWKDYSDYLVRFSQDSTWIELKNILVDENGGIVQLTPNTSYQLHILPTGAPSDTEPVTLVSQSDSDGTLHLMWPTWQSRVRRSDESSWSDWRDFRIAQNNLTIGTISVVRSGDPPLQTPNDFARDSQLYSIDVEGLTAGLRYDVQVRPFGEAWIGDVAQVSRVADEEQVLTAVWQDPNEYLVRFDSQGLWSNLSDIVTEGTHGIGQLEPGQNYGLQILPRDAPADTTPFDLYSSATSDGVIYLYWPSWQYRLRSPNDNSLREWREVSLTEDNLSLFSRSATILSAATFRKEAGDTAVMVKRRWRSYELGVERITDKPFFGHGLRKFASLEGAYVGYQGIPYGIHNIYLMLLGEAGLLPFILYLTFLVYLILIAIKSSAILERDLLTLLLIVIVIYGLTYHHLFISGFFNAILGMTSAIAGHLAYQNRYPEFSRQEI